jgi:hypothetical protein
MRQPPAVFIVSFVTLAILYLLRIRQINLEVGLQYVENRLPVRGRGFHHDMRHSFLFQPVAQAFQLRHDCPKASLLCARFPIQRSGHRAHGQERFPHVDPGASLYGSADHLCSPFWQENSRHLHKYILPRLDCSIRGFYMSA